MKYLKLFETIQTNNSSYEEVGQHVFFLNDEASFSNSRSIDIEDRYINIIMHKIPSFIKVRLNKKIIMNSKILNSYISFYYNDVRGGIYQYLDEYFFVSFCDENGDRYFKCDQIDGLLKLIDDLNLKSYKLF